LPFGAPRGPFDDFCAGREIERGNLPCPYFFGKDITPRLESIDPCLHRIAVVLELVNLEATLPTVVDERLHGGYVPTSVSLFTVEQHSRQKVMAVGENIRFDGDLLAHHAFCGESAAIDLGLNAFDNDALSAFSGMFHVSPTSSQSPVSFFDF
jgi:hypothetical protein